jgi:hypothetical protein
MTKQSATFWMLGVLITFFTAYFQRVTGPTYPVSGAVTLGDREIAYKLDRTHPGSTNAPIRIRTDDASIQGEVFWKRYKTDDQWTKVAMAYEEGYLTAALPHQPSAGKLLYRLDLLRGDQRVGVPGSDPIVIRFRGETPLYVLIPHVLAMFIAMLLSARTGLESFAAVPKLKKFLFWTLGFLFVGGFVLGPVVQYYAFDTWWTGWPVGTDLTDNKTAVAFVGWIIAAIALYKAKNPKPWVLGAAILLIVVYLIPHSMLGSELDYKALEKELPNTETTR